MLQPTDTEIKTYKKRALPANPKPNAVYYILPINTTAVIVYITDINGIPIKVIDLTGGTGSINSVTGTGVTGTSSNPTVNISTFVSSQLGNQVYLSLEDGKLQVNPITSPDSSIEITSTNTELQLQLSSAIVAQINSALQAGDNISNLVNDAGYITLSDVDGTDLSYSPSPTNGVVASSTGTDATLPLADTINAGLLSPSEKVKLNNTSGINSGDQTSIVGITGTKAQFNTSVTDGDILYVGDITQYTDELSQDAIGNILIDTSTIDLTYNDSTPSISANVKPNSITATELGTINISEFINDSGYISDVNLGYTPSATNGIVTNDKGTDATIPTADFTNSGLLTPEEKQLLYNNASTGVTRFDGFSINVDTTKFDRGVVEGWFVDNTTNPNIPIKVFKSFPATTGNTLTNIATQNVTYIAIDINGVMHQSGMPDEPEIQRDWIPLGVIVHSNRVIINAVNNQPVVAISPNNQLSDLIESIGFFNISGNVFSPNGANLNINKSAGHVFKQGSNFLNNNKDPHTLGLSALVAPNNIRYRTQIGTEFANTAVIDAGFYDLAGVRTAIPGTRWSIQRIYLFQSNLVRIQYGQATYTTKVDAIQAITTEAFVVEQNILENGLFRGLLIIREATTDLTDTSRALFIEASKFGSVAGLGSLSTTSLQQAYNNSLTPEITTNSTLGAVSIKRGSASDTDFVFEGQNGAGTTTSSISGNGALTALTYNGYTPENVANKVTDFTTINNILYPSVQAINDRFINKTSEPQTKIGGLTIGTNLYHPSDNWIALGTSVTHDGNYTVYMGSQLGLIVNNFGVSGSTSNNLASQYVNIPTLTVGNIDNYRLLSIEHGINDAAQSVPLATYRTNLENCIANAKGKGWANNKILIINSNYCTSGSVLGLQAYADEAILIAKEQGVQYVDIYNYTKNNGGASLLLDGIHPSPEGGKIYARGVTSGMYGGFEATNVINSVNGINAFGNIVAEKKLTVGDIAQTHQLKIYHTAGEALSSLPALGSSSEKLIYTNGNVYGLVGDLLNTGVSYFQSQRTDGTVSSFPLSLQPKGGNIYFGTSASIGSEKFQFTGDIRTTLDSYVNSLRIGRGSNSIISNTVVGINSLVSTSAATSDNTAIGAGVLTSGVTIARNTGIGSGALFKTSGNSNTAVGAYALYENTSGGGNAAFGFQAGTYLLDGTTPNAAPSSSVYFGTGTKSFAAGQTNETVIGHQANGAGSNTVTIGNTSVVNTYLKGNVNLSGLTISSTPTTSAGTYDFLTRNTSTGVVEKVTSASVAPIASPALTGTPTAPTATAGTNTTQLATTAFVQNAVSSGTYTPTLTNTTNISSSTLNVAYYTKIGNLVTVDIAVQTTITTTASATVLTFSLPISGATTANGIGQGNLTSGGAGVNGYGVVDITNSTTGQLRIGKPDGTGAGLTNIIFTYSL